MPIETVDKSGILLTIKVKGKLKKAELEQGQSAAIEIIKSEGKVRILVIAENFQGWEREGDWGDVSFQMDYDRHIEKIALVGEKRWEDLITPFVGKGMRPVDIQFFPSSELVKARAWIAS
jgi:stage II sporulation SpoAA-like protein